jgi:hypothetical protein
MIIGNSHSRAEYLGPEAIPLPWWMSPTSHLAHHPLGAAVARSPHPASGGGGEGWSILLVSQSERGGDRRGALFEARSHGISGDARAGLASERSRVHAPSRGSYCPTALARSRDASGTNNSWG